MAMIIVEGMDDSGKTTLLRTLSRRLKIENIVESPGPMTREQMEQAIKDGLEKARSNDGDILFDRFRLISETIYGPILRGKSEFEKDFNLWLQELLELRPIIIYCRPPRDAMLANDRNQLEGVKNNKNELIDAYDKFMADLVEHHYKEFDLIVYDYTVDPDCEVILKELEVD